MAATRRRRQEDGELQGALSTHPHLRSGLEIPPTRASDEGEDRRGRSHRLAPPPTLGCLPWRSDEEVRQLYREWKAKHGRSYHALGEDQRRFTVFKDNLRYIDEQNAAADRGEHTFRLGLTPFADLSGDEYRATYLGFRNLLDGGRSSSSAVSDRYLPSEDDDLPDYVESREMGAVAPIKNQRNCGSSWAFSAIAAVEGINQIVTGDFIVLSEQELVDCDTNFDKGCEDGRMDYAFEFIISNGGIDTEEDYPYRARAGPCDTSRRNAKVVSIDSYEDVPVNNEHALQKAVANQPVSVAIDVSGRNFQHYQSGVFDGECGNDVNHGAVVVGYGREKEQDYWIVKNSWSDRWGEAGYARIQRNFAASSAGKCGIAVAPSYPVKTGSNPPPQPPPPPVKPPSSCGKFHSCPASTTCCCLSQFDDICLVPACCPGEDAVCCNDGRSCCPRDYPVCDLMYGICDKSKNNRLGVKALKRIPAKPLFSDSGSQAQKSSE